MPQNLIIWKSRLKYFFISIFFKLLAICHFVVFLLLSKISSNILILLLCLNSIVTYLSCLFCHWPLWIYSNRLIMSTCLHYILYVSLLFTDYSSKRYLNKLALYAIHWLPIFIWNEPCELYNCYFESYILLIPFGCNYC